MYVHICVHVIYICLICFVAVCEHSTACVRVSRASSCRLWEHQERENARQVLLLPLKRVPLPKIPPTIARSGLSSLLASEKQNCSMSMTKCYSCADIRISGYVWHKYVDVHTQCIYVQFMHVRWMHVSWFHLCTGKIESSQALDVPLPARRTRKQNEA